MQAGRKGLQMSTDLAPIGLSTYARLQHLKMAVEALQKNTLAEQSELYVFSDAPKPGDEERVASVRSYLRTIDCFKNVHIVERESNGRVANSRGGINMLLEQFGKAIFLAEDVVTAPGFLAFMNQALDKYENNERVFSIAGYCPPIPIPENYKHDVFFLRRFNGWGFGIWKNRFDRLGYMTPEEYERFAADKKRMQEFIKGGGADMMAMLKMDAFGGIDAGDVKAMYAQYLSNQYTVYPIRSLVQNIGLDGTGTHCYETNRFEVMLSDTTSFSFPEELVIAQRIILENFRFRDVPSPVRRLVWRIRSYVSKLLVPHKNKVRTLLNLSVRK